MPHGSGVRSWHFGQTRRASARVAGGTPALVAEGGCSHIRSRSPRGLEGSAALHGALGVSPPVSCLHGWREAARSVEANRGSDSRGIPPRTRFPVRFPLLVHRRQGTCPIQARGIRARRSRSATSDGDWIRSIASRSRVAYGGYFRTDPKVSAATELSRLRHGAWGARSLCQHCALRAIPRLPRPPDICYAKPRERRLVPRRSGSCMA
jgi:hypothetical protein